MNCEVFAGGGGGGGNKRLINQVRSLIIMFILPLFYELINI